MLYHLTNPVAKTATLCSPPTLLTSAAAFFNFVLFCPPLPHSSFTPELCLDLNSAVLPAHKHICLRSAVVELGTAGLWNALGFEFYTQTKGSSGFMGYCWQVRRRHKQMFWVGLHLLWALLISSGFAPVIYGALTTLRRISRRLQRPAGGRLSSHSLRLMFSRPVVFAKRARAPRQTWPRPPHLRSASRPHASTWCFYFFSPLSLTSLHPCE